MNKRAAVSTAVFMVAFVVFLVSLIIWPSAVGAVVAWAIIALTGLALVALSSTYVYVYIAGVLESRDENKARDDFNKKAGSSYEGYTSSPIDYLMNDKVEEETKEVEFPLDEKRDPEVSTDQFRL